MKRIDPRIGQRKRVVIVDDSKTMQAILDQIFSLRLGLDVVGIASDGKSAVAMIQELRPDLVTIDLCMPYIDGRKLLEMVADVQDLQKIIISGSACDNLAMVTKLMEAGADACIGKMEMSQNPDAFCRKIRAVLAKPKTKSPVMADDKCTAAANVVRFGPPIKPPVPVDEKARLALLAQLGLANDEIDDQFDLLTAHMGATTDFPTCLITFIDQQSQWVKSAYGFARGSMPRAIAFCNYTLCSDDPFIVSNAATDPRFATNALVVAGPRIRTYVGCPIISDTGVRLGAICLIDTKSRRVGSDVVANLRSISKIAAELIKARAGSGGLAQAA